MSDNVRFEDWEKEQMQDPAFRAALERLEPAYQVARLRMLRGWTQAADRHNIAGVATAVAKSLDMSLRAEGGCCFRPERSNLHLAPGEPMVLYVRPLWVARTQTSDPGKAPVRNDHAAALAGRCLTLSGSGDT